MLTFNKTWSDSSRQISCSLNLIYCLREIKKYLIKPSFKDNLAYLLHSGIINARIVNKGGFIVKIEQPTIREMN